MEDGLGTGDTAVESVGAMGPPLPAVLGSTVSGLFLDACSKKKNKKRILVFSFISIL